MAVGRRIKVFAKEFLEGLLDLVFPPRCLVCGKYVKEIICKECWSKIAVIKPAFCECCGLPFDRGVKDVRLCKACRKNTYRFNYARSVGPYKGVLRECIHLLKYRGKKTLAKPLGELMAKQLLVYSSPQVQNIDFIIPVPLHPKRERERGFNQAKLLAEVIGEKLDISVSDGILVRQRFTESQFSLSLQERKRNVAGAFKVINPEKIAGKNILLVDDIFTTGSTLNECAKALRKCKAASIFAFALARDV